MTGNSNIFKTIWKNGNKEHDDKYVCCFFMIWNLIFAAKYKFGRLVLFFTSVNYAISQLTLIFFHVIFKLHFNVSYFSTFIFTLYIPCFPFFLIDHNQKVLLIKWVTFSWSSEISHYSFQPFENYHIRNVLSTFINVMKLYVETALLCCRLAFK